MSNPIQTSVPSRRLLRTFVLTSKQGYRLRAYDNATEKVAFLSDAEAGVGGDFLFKAEPKHDLIEAGLGVLFEEFDGCDKGWSPQPTEKLWSKPIFCMKCQPRNNPGYVRNERT
ncbi:hypothetical protein ABID58_007419 [Bradyrhizobium sp. S3.2.6]